MHNKQITNLVNNLFPGQSETILYCLNQIETKDNQEALDLVNYIFNERLVKPSVDNWLSLDYIMSLGIHLGHQTGSWNPNMSPYIYGERNGHHIIDLNKTLIQLRLALKVVQSISSSGGSIIFVGTKPHMGALLSLLVPEGHYYMCSKWLGGFLTNWSQMKEYVNSTNNLSTAKRKRIKKYYAGIFDTNGSFMKELPSCIIFLHVNEHQKGISEAIKINIPTVGIVDTDGNPSGVDYVVAGNDDTLKAQYFYVQLFCTMLSNSK